MKTPLTAAIIDDESDSRKIIRNYLNHYGNHQFKVLWESDSVAATIKMLVAQTPDLLFLDINLPDGTGFDVLTTMGKPGFQIIFITAFDTFAVKAFQFAAIDYLLKPLDPLMFNNALDRVIQNNSMQHYMEKVAQLLVFNQTRKFENIVLSTEAGLEIIPLSEIVRLEADGSYTSFFLISGERLLASKTLGEFEHLLPSSDFFRVHYSHIVNLSFVKKYLKEEGGILVLKNGDRVEIARRRKEALLDLLYRR